MSTLFDIWNTIQYKLFPWLEEELNPLTEKEQQFIQVISLIELRTHTQPYAGAALAASVKIVSASPNLFTILRQQRF